MEGIEEITHEAVRTVRATGDTNDKKMLVDEDNRSEGCISVRARLVINWDPNYSSYKGH